MELPEDVAQALRRLSRHYIPPRYPDPHPGGAPLAHYGAEDAEEALSGTDLVIGYVASLWTELLAAEATDEDEKKGGEDGDGD